MPARGVGAPPAGAAANKKKRVPAHKKGAGTAPLKKKVFNVDDDTNAAAFLEDLEVEVRSRCNLITFDAERQREAIKAAYGSELIKIPLAIRGMNARKFCLEFDGDMRKVLEHDRKMVLQTTGLRHNLPPSSAKRAGTNGGMLRSVQAISRNMSARRGKMLLASGNGGNPATALGIRQRVAVQGSVLRRPGGADAPLATPLRGPGPEALHAHATDVPGLALAPAETPRFDARLLQTPATVLASKVARPMKRGESIMSVNGSPLVGEGGTASPAPPPRPPFAAHALGMEPRELATSLLQARGKDATIEELAALKDQVASLMESISGK